MPPAQTQSPPFDLAAPRARIAHALVSGFTALGLVAYIPSVWLAVRVGAWGIAALDTAVYLLLLAAFFFGRGRPRLQAGVVVAACYALGTALGALLGPVGAGPLWLAATPIAAGILFDRRRARLAFIAVLVTLGVLAALEGAGVLAWPNPVAGPVLWIVLGANALLVAGALGFAVAALADGLRSEMVERHRVENRLRESDKLQAVGTLAAGIAHDFNNLLTPILSSTEMARSAAEPGSEQHEALDQAVGAALAGRDLVLRILAFSRPTDRDGPTPAADAFRDAIRLLRASLPAGVAVERELQDSGHLTTLSAAEVHQVVLNLGTNARRAMPDGGTLAFRLRVHESGGDGAANGAGARTAVLRLDVEDDGLGMTPDVAKRIFEPFFTTDQDQGTGLGLATVHGIVDRAGGRIECRSTPGTGTIFTIELPALPPTARRADADEWPIPDGGGRRILVVDDEPAVRDVAARVLERHGYATTTATDGPTALRALDTHDPGPDLVLSDLNMPAMDGLRLAEEVRRRRPGTPVILMSGLVDAELRDLARRTGVCAVVSKPFRLRTLVRQVGDALAAPVE